jgi:polyribonucleotide nucleotidyltransferase
VAKVNDVVKEGDKVKVKLLGFDERGKIRLSMKVVDQETGEDITDKIKAQRDAERAERGEGPEEEREERTERPRRDDRGGRDRRPRRD